MDMQAAGYNRLLLIRVKTTDKIKLQLVKLYFIYLNVFCEFKNRF